MAVLEQEKPVTHLGDLKGAITWSHSRLDLHDLCRRKWYEVYVNDNREGHTEATALGDVVHVALLGERDEKTGEVIRPGFLARLRAGEDVDKYVLNETVKEVFEEKSLEHPECFNRFSLPAAIKMAQAAVKRLPPNPRTWEFEVLRKRKLFNGDYIRGFLDLRYQDGDTVVIRDFKTGYNVYGVDDTHQLGVYGALEAAGGAKKIRVELHFLRTDMLLAKDVTDDMILRAREWVQRKVVEIRAALGLEGDAGFPPTPNRLCQYCHVADTCPAAMEARRARALADLDWTPEQAREAAEQAVLLQGVLESLTKKIGKWVEANGPLPINGARWEYVETPRLEWDVDGVIDLLHGREGLPYGDFLQVKGRRLRDLIASSPYGEELAGFANVLPKPDRELRLVKER